MTSVTAEPTDAIAALLEERRRYEGWLASLEQRRSATPAAVYARVKQDYENRLAQVVEQLGGRSAELQQAVDQLSARVSSLESEENRQIESRAEAELRAAVGEYSPEQWAEIRESADQDIARLTQERGEAQKELNQLQELLTLATSTRSVAKPEAPAVTAASTVPTPMPTLTPVPSGTPATDKPDATPPFLRDVQAEQVKSLKCSECGTMNFPTEWYCERCGGELAAM